MRSKDPQHLTLERLKLLRDLSKRFRVIKREVTNLVVKEDAFGLAIQNRYQFLTTPQKLTAFRDWLNSMSEQQLLAPVEGGREIWMSSYLESAYKKGHVRAFLEKNRRTARESKVFRGRLNQFLESAFAAPVRTDQVEMLYLRSFEGMKGVTADMSNRMSTVLADGMLTGEHPSSVARKMNRAVDKIHRGRAQVIARTELARAYSQGQLAGFRALGVEDLGVEVELSTAGDNRVCSQCISLEGKTFKTAEADGIIPVHPNCRCAWIPAAISVPKR